MDPATVIAIITALLNAANQTPALIQAGKVAIDCLTHSRDPSPDEQAIIDAALEDADKSLPAN